MKQQEKELLVARILSGYSKLNINNETYLLYPPTIDQLYDAQELYDKIYNRALLDGMMTEEQALGMLIELELWNEELEKELIDIQKQIEDDKVKLYELVFKNVQRELTRKFLEGRKKRLNILQENRGAYNYITAEGVASLSKTRFILSCGLRTKDKKKYWRGDFYNEPDPLIDSVMEEYYRNLLDEGKYRELARTEPWRMTWGLKKAGSPVVHSSCANISNEQKVLFFWSLIYDNIYESPECPPDTVLEDDDMTDGWLILQRRKREDALDKQQLEGAAKISDKMKNAQEIYIMADSMEGAKKVDKLNDDFNRGIKRQRMALLRKMGELNELDMPDTKREIHMQFNQLERDRLK